MALTDKLTSIANAIRAKTGKSATMSLDEMPSEIASISGGGGLETYSVTAKFTKVSSLPSIGMYMLYYIDANGNVAMINSMQTTTTTVTAMKNSPMWSIEAIAGIHMRIYGTGGTYYVSNPNADPAYVYGITANNCTVEVKY